MPHEVETMFYTNQKPWWLGNQWQGDAVGTYVGDKALRAADAIVMAGLPWMVQMCHAALWTGQEVDDPNGTWLHVEDSFFLRRTDTGAVLGRCQKGYRPFQNIDVFNFLDSLREGEGLRYHTAGSLMGGKKIWVLAEMPQSFKIGRLSGEVNTHHAFLLVTAGHTGYDGINILPTKIRVECLNTSNMAEATAEGEALKFSVAHDANTEAKLRVAAAAISKIPQAMIAEQEILQELARDRMTTEEFIDFATSIFLQIESVDPQEVEAKVRGWYEDEKTTPRQKTIMENRVAEVTKLFLNGQGNEGNTAYDALSAFEEFADHAKIAEQIKTNISKAQRVARMEGIVNSSWFGAGGRRKALVYKRLRSGQIQKGR